MARKKRCNLCGAKLKGDICQECGYNNAAYDYKVNSSEDYCGHSSSETFYDKADHKEHAAGSADSWDYSHIEDLLGKEYGTEEAATPNEAPVTYGLNEERSQKKKKKRRWVKWLVFACFLPTIIELIGGLIFNVVEYGIVERVEEKVEVTPVEEVPTIPESNASLPDAMELLEKVLAESEKQSSEEKPEGAEEPVMTVAEGEYQTELKAGIYMAGLHIPAGVYDAQLVSGSGSIYIRNMDTDYWESDYLYEGSSKKEKQMKDLELTAGTQIKIMDELVMEFTTEESQGYLAEWENQQMLKMVSVADGMIAGEHFEAGTYDVICSLEDNGIGMLVRKFQSYYGDEELEQMMFYEENTEFKNLTLEEGDMILTLNCEIELRPADYDLSGILVAW